MIGGIKGGLVRRLIATDNGEQLTRLRGVPPRHPGRRVHPLDAWEQAMVEGGAEDTPGVASTPRYLRYVLLCCVVVEIVAAGLICWMLW